MKKLSLILIFLLPFSSHILAKDIYGIEVTAIYQLEDEVNPPFDFQSKHNLHKCGGKKSNHFRVYSDDITTGNRRFKLLLSAFSQQTKISVGTMKCEGKRMITSWIRLSR
jgi:hypothetical protein